ncbi:KGK domain-containing protein [Microcoleus sp. FACHB-68]|uniref:KGK domain-containing protein n=1 Tax=Microcoleus sp. FACHB-68 TaxID=2692826 RepID=UPI00168205AE|nr:KGK domain-containing protein [Microcoleus sp. FACHB-68]MBD1937276.1 hypothetical protein [Microcoleus sp. FACHB-68]
MPFEPLEDAENILEIYSPGEIRLSLERIQIVSRLIKSLDNLFLNSVIADKRLTDEGRPARLLKLGSSQWVKGKIRLRLLFEFCPDEPETPALPASGLDEFRQ